MNGSAIVHSTKWPQSAAVNPSTPSIGGMNPVRTLTPPTSHGAPTPLANDRGLPVPEFPWSQSITYLLADYEQRLIDHAMRNADGVKRQAATLLGISRYALERRIRRLRALRDKAAAGHPESE